MALQTAATMGERCSGTKCLFTLHGQIPYMVRTLRIINGFLLITIIFLNISLQKQLVVITTSFFSSVDKAHQGFSKKKQVKMFCTHECIVSCYMAFYNAHLKIISSDLAL